MKFCCEVVDSLWSQIKAFTSIEWIRLQKLTPFFPLHRQHLKTIRIKLNYTCKKVSVLRYFRKEGCPRLLFTQINLYCWFLQTKQTRHKIIKTKVFYIYTALNFPDPSTKCSSCYKEYKQCGAALRCSIHAQLAPSQLQVTIRLPAGVDDHFAKPPTVTRLAEWWLGGEDIHPPQNHARDPEQSSPFCLHPEQAVLLKERCAWRKG